ncbi:MAG TPA: hypothetical protein VJ032_03760 [Thermoanaerobaculia bacterium]|nr:hypothetical protein [Thermoanaerobaculia bacterium]
MTRSAGVPARWSESVSLSAARGVKTPPKTKVVIEGNSNGRDKRIEFPKAPARGGRYLVRRRTATP